MQGRPGLSTIKLERFARRTHAADHCGFLRAPVTNFADHCSCTCWQLKNRRFIRLFLKPFSTLSASVFILVDIPGHPPDHPSGAEQNMNQRPHDHLSQVFHLDVTPGSAEPAGVSASPSGEIADLLRQLVVGQDRQNELLEDLVEQMNAAQRQRAAELGQWKEANPVLARRCRAAAEALGQVQTEFIENLTTEVNENYEGMLDGEFVLNEFVDRFGPRLAHLNGVLQLLSQLSSMPGQHHQR
jgi:hypothetical protein